MGKEADMKEIDEFIGWWMVVVVIVTAIALYNAVDQEPICKTDPRWPCPTEVKP